MNYLLESHHGNCPSCGEPIEVLIESIDERQSYVEDCQVCCRPMVIQVGEDGRVDILSENDAFIQNA